jgi:hypothetical protein
MMEKTLFGRISNGSAKLNKHMMRQLMLLQIDLAPVGLVSPGLAAEVLTMVIPDTVVNLYGKAVLYTLAIEQGAIAAEYDYIHGTESDCSYELGCNRYWWWFEGYFNRMKEIS